MRMISGSLQRSKTFDFHNKAKNLYDSTMKAWVDEFRSSSNFLGLSLREAVDRAMTFLKADLKPFAPDPALFTSVVANRISLIFRNFIEKDSATLESMLMYLWFADGLYVKPEEAKYQKIEILKVLSIMPDLNRYSRMAYANDLKIQTEN